MSGIGNDNIYSINAGKRTKIGEFYQATIGEIEIARHAKSTFKMYKDFSGALKAAFLEAMALEIEQLGDSPTRMAMAVGPATMLQETIWKRYNKNRFQVISQEGCN